MHQEGIVLACPLTAQFNSTAIRLNPWPVSSSGKGTMFFKALWKHTGDAKLGSCIESVPSMGGADTSEMTCFLACRAKVVHHWNKIIFFFSSPHPPPRFDSANSWGGASNSFSAIKGRSLQPISSKLPAAISFKAISSALESPWSLAYHRNFSCSPCVTCQPCADGDVCRREIWRYQLAGKNHMDHDDPKEM